MSASRAGQGCSPPRTGQHQPHCCGCDTQVKFGDSKCTSETTMSAKPRTRLQNGSGKRKGHLRSKVEKRDDDIIHVRNFARIPSLFCTNDRPDEVLRRTIAVLFPNDVFQDYTSAMNPTSTNLLRRSMFAVTHLSTVAIGYECMQ